MTIMDWWNNLTPDSQEKVILAIVTALVTLGITVFVPKVLWPPIQNFLVWLAEKVYERVAGWSMFNWWGLKRYKVALKKQMERLSNPWSNQKMLMGNVFVPIKVDPTYLLPHYGSSKTPEELVDLKSAVGTYKRFVLVGNPGAGKSTAVKNIGLAALENRLSNNEQKLPVFIELRKFSVTQKSLQEYIFDVFSLYEFPGANEFAQKRMEKGNLIVLLDGLDEVNEEQFLPVVDSIRLFCEQYPDNNLIVTCRMAHYDRQLDDISESTVALTDFNDVQISTFLRHWKFPEGKTSTELMKILRERPRILNICRTPLMLTIVTSLYIETDYELPSSRSEFYTTCVDAVLKKWDTARHIERYNKFKAPLKERILQNLAWELHSRDNHTGDIDFNYLVDFVARFIPSQGLEANLAEDIVIEIIRNSGLILPVAPQKLRYAHLTFQEYFVARYADANGITDDLILCYRSDVNKWREVCLLFAGLSSKSPIFINAISKFDVVMAGNCIADGETIDLNIAETVIKELEKRIELGVDKDNSRLTHESSSIELELRRELDALSAMASDTRKTWAHNALASLNRLYKRAERVDTLSAILVAYANIPSSAAVNVLMDALRHSDLQYAAKESLARLGVISFPAIKRLLGLSAELDLIKPCLEICTQVPAPEVLDLVLPLLRSKDENIRSYAAWAIGVLLQEPSIEQALYLMNEGEIGVYIPPDSKIDQLAEWVWPFDQKVSSSVPKLVAVIVSSLSNTHLEDLVNTYSKISNIDIRIAIPVSIEWLSLYSSTKISEEASILLKSLLIRSNNVYLPKENVRRTEIPISTDERFKKGIVEFFSTNRNIQRYRDAWKNIGVKKHSKFLSFISKPLNWAKTFGYIYIIVVIACIAANVIYFQNIAISFEVSIGQLIALLISVEFWANQDNEKFIRTIWKPPLILSGLLEYFAVGRRNFFISSGLLANVIFVISSPWYIDVSLSKLTGFGFTWILMCVFIIVGNLFLYIPTLNIPIMSTIDWNMFLKQPIHSLVSVIGERTVDWTEIPNIRAHVQDKSDDIFSEYRNR